MDGRQRIQRRVRKGESKLLGFSIESDGPLRKPVSHRQGHPRRQHELGSLCGCSRHAESHAVFEGQLVNQHWTRTPSCWKLLETQ